MAAKKNATLSKQPMPQQMHVCLCFSERDPELLEKAAEAGSVQSWIVPSRARIGDRALFFLGSQGFLGTGIISTESTKAKAQELGWKNRYAADVSSIHLFPFQVPLNLVATSFPGWAWARYPRMLTTVPETIAKELTLRLDELGGDLPLANDVDDTEASVIEGSVQVRLHRSRERNSAIVAAKKKQVLQTMGSLTCQVCRFDFLKVYGKLGVGFCEVHHLSQLSGSEEEVQTKLEDLAIVCSNCHRMIHRQYPSLTLQALREALAVQSK